MPTVEIEDTIDEVLRCKNSLPSYDQYQPIVYEVPSLRGFLIRPEIYHSLQFKVELVKANNAVEAIGKDAEICLANYPLNSLFGTVDIEFRNCNIMPASTLTAYCGFMRVMQDFDLDGRRSLLSRSLWAQDLPGSHNKFTAGTDPEDPYKARHDPLVKKGTDDAIIDLYGPVLLDPFRIDQPFPDDVEMRLVFHRNSPNFALNGKKLASGEHYRITFVRANLCLTRLKMAPNQDLYGIAGIGRTIRYPYTSFESRYITIPANNGTISEDILMGPLPNRIMFLMVDQDAYMGNLEKNPFEFKHFFVKNLFLRKNQNISLPAEPFTTKMEEYTKTIKKKNAAGTEVDENETVKNITEYSRLYVETFRILNQYGPLSNTNFGISFYDYSHGYFLIAYDLRSDRSPSPKVTTMPTTGTLRLEMTLHETLTKPMVLIVISEYQRILNIPEKIGDVYVE